VRRRQRFIIIDDLVVAAADVLIGARVFVIAVKLVGHSPGRQRGRR
jgi:hypothetical protein